jgi:hypothetical protein
VQRFGSPQAIDRAISADKRAREMWMSAPVEFALALQRPPSAGAFKIVAVDTKQDAGPEQCEYQD